jgi:SAM-dependent methyltransferase
MQKQDIDAKTGYDRWADTYDETENPVVWMDGWALTERLTVQKGDRVLDAGCGTGRNFPRLLAQGAIVTGVDFSSGMLRVAGSKFPDVELVEADLQSPWPFDADSFDLVVCALVGEHLGALGHVFREANRVLTARGRLIFSVYHPAMALAGKEARFVEGDIEYRLGAHMHVLDDYHEALKEAGFSVDTVAELSGPPELADALPSKAKYVGFPLLVVFEASVQR